MSEPRKSLSEVIATVLLLICLPTCVRFEICADDSSHALVSQFTNQGICVGVSLRRVAALAVFSVDVDQRRLALQETVVFRRNSESNPSSDYLLATQAQLRPVASISCWSRYACVGNNNR